MRSGPAWAGGLVAALAGCSAPAAPPAGEPEPGIASVAPEPQPPAPAAETPAPGPQPPAPAAGTPAPAEPPPEPEPPPAVPTQEPPAPVTALDGHALLEAWRARAREEASGGPRDLALARSHLLENQPLKAYEILKTVDPKTLPSDEARLGWRLALADACCRLGEFDRASDLLREAETAIRPFAPLRISGACFTSNPRGRAKIEPARFRPGAMVTAYLDVERLGLKAEADGRARTHLRFDLTLMEPSGRAVWDFAEWERAQGSLEESSHRPWEDHAYRLTFRLPKGVNLGDYLLRVDVSDLTSSPVRRAAASLPLTLE